MLQKNKEMRDSHRDPLTCKDWNKHTRVTRVNGPTKQQHHQQRYNNAYNNYFILYKITQMKNARKYFGVFRLDSKINCSFCLSVQLSFSENPLFTETKHKLV